MEIIKIIRNTVCGGQPVNAGDIIEASAHDAKVLICLGKAGPASEKQIKSFEKARSEAEKKAADEAGKPGGDPPAGPDSNPDADGADPAGDKQ